MSKAENSSFTHFFGSVTVETDEQTRDVVQTQSADGLRIKSLPFHLFPAARLHIRNLVWHINEVNKSIFAAQWAQTAALPLHVKQKPCVNKALSSVTTDEPDLRGASYVFTWLHWKENESCLFRQLILHPSETLNLYFHHVYLFMDEHSVCGFMLLLESDVIHMKPLMHTLAAIRQKAVSMFLCLTAAHPFLLWLSVCELHCNRPPEADHDLPIWADFWWCHTSHLFVLVNIRGDLDWMSLRQAAKIKHVLRLF